MKQRAMTQRKFLAVLIGGAMLGIGPSSATASLITWEFAGEITSVFDSEDLLGDSVVVGSPFSGSFTFESETPDIEESPGFGGYSGAITGVSGHVGPISFLGSGGGSTNEIIILNANHPGESDHYSLRLSDVETPLLGEMSNFSISLSDNLGAVFESDLLPLVPPDLSLFSSSTFSLRTTSNSVIFNGKLTSLIPEPATLSLLGLGALAALRRRKRYSGTTLCGWPVLSGAKVEDPDCVGADAVIAWRLDRE